MRKLFILFFFFATCANAQSLASGVISIARSMQWQYAGIPGGLPDASWSQCGATISAGASAATIQGALNHTGSGYTGCTPPYYIQLGSGTFSITTGICGTVSQTVLRGMGPNLTHVVPSGNAGCGGLSNAVGFTTSDSTCFYGCTGQTVTTWTAGYTQGGTSITLASVTGIVPTSSGAPTMVFLNQNDTGYSGWTPGSPSTGSATDNGNYFECADQYSATGPTGCANNGPESNGIGTGNDLLHRWQYEIVTASAVNSGTGVLTLNQPLEHPNWTSGQSPVAVIVQSIQQVGIENLSIDLSGDGSVFAGITFNGCYECWASGVQIQNFPNFGIDYELSTHYQVQNSYFYHSTGGDSYGIRFGQMNSDGLVQNNIFEQVESPVVSDGPNPGRVLGYNFAINDTSPSDGMIMAWWAHSAGDDYELYEGNIAPGNDLDLSHGTHLDATMYRNFQLGWDSCGNGQCGGDPAKDSGTLAVNVFAYNRYVNLVANVLGTPGYTTGYTSTSGQNAYVYNLGAGDASQPPDDSLVISTSYRWANYDVFHAAVQYNSGEVPTGISPYPNSVPTGSCVSASPACPASFYLSSKPTWFGSIPWPAIGPDVSSGNVGQCAGTINTPGQVNGLPATSNAQCTGSSLTTPSWGGHVNAIPAYNCFLNVMNGIPDGTDSSPLTFNPSSCYPSSPSSSPSPASLGSLFTDNK